MMSGGKGGKGNARFTTSRRHCPHFAQKGEKTEVKRVRLELKVIADVGLIGIPSVGKSTLLSKIFNPFYLLYHKFCSTARDFTE